MGSNQLKFKKIINRQKIINIKSENISPKIRPASEKNNRVVKDTTRLLKTD